MTDRVRMECTTCGYKSVPQWLNDQAHCLKCQTVLRKRPQGAGAGAGVQVLDAGRRLPGEASTHRQSPGEAREFTSGACGKSPDGRHHWKFGKCSFCHAPEQQASSGVRAPVQAVAAVPRPGIAEEASKACRKCGKSFAGHGDTCASCRTITKSRGSSRQCADCGGFFWGFGDACEDCAGGAASAATAAQTRNERVKVQCPKCDYTCVPQWLNDQAHCLKCQAVLLTQDTIHGRPLPKAAAAGERRQAGEVSTYKYAPGSAMESSSGTCTKAPDGAHHWKFGKCEFCLKPEGKLAKGPGVMANPGGAGGCEAGGKCMFKFAKCTKCGRKAY